MSGPVSTWMDDNLLAGM